MNNLWLIFLTGLTAGGLSCLAVQGGLLASSMASDTEQNKSGKLIKISSFLIAKIIAYTLLGFGLGAVGKALIITPNVLGWMQVVAGLFMLITAARLLNLHPFFRYFVIQPPKFIYRFIKNKSGSDSVFAPAMLGFMTILIPCGITQGMMILAVSSANPLYGAAIMFVFTVGTSPVFLLVGLAINQLLKRKIFAYATYTIIIILGLLSINSGQALRGSAHTFQNYWLVTKDLFTPQNTEIVGLAKIGADGKQNVTINVEKTSYQTSTTTLMVDVPVKLSLVTNNVKGCTRGFTIPSLNFSKVLPETGVEIVEFTPTKTGRITFICNMGMYGGQFSVIN